MQFHFVWFSYKVTVLNLIDGHYQENIFTGTQLIQSATYPTLQLPAEALLNGDIDQD
ncbi:MAG: hypothetical protein AAF810_03725 [Cyanobacteria bacterium P01_D01_bin.36]